MSTLSVNHVKKILFHTPSPATAGPSFTSEDAKSMILKSQSDSEVELALKKSEKARHKQRLKKLKKELDTLSLDDWKYPAVESLIGLK